MNMSADQKVHKITNYLLHLCHENGLFPKEINQVSVSDDLIEEGLIDSMGLVYIQGIILENFALELELELFIVELRNIESIASYLAENVADDWFYKNSAFSTKVLGDINDRFA